MPKSGFVLDRKGVRELLKSAEMQTVIGEYTKAVENSAGDGYASNVQTANRAVGRVYVASSKAAKDNSDNNTLLKALGRTYG